MKKKHKPLKLLADKVIYKLDDISMITPELLNGIDFMRLKRCTIFFKKKIEKEWVFGVKKFPKKSISIIYSVNKTKLKIPKIINKEKFRVIRLDPNAFLSFYYDTKKEFYDKFKTKMGNKFWQEYSFVVSKLLLKGKHICVSSNAGQKVALLSMIRWKDVSNKPVDWVNWVWISNDVKKEDKIYLRYILKDWIKINASCARIQCLVNSFNIPSQKFFNKLGFNPECLNILKLSE